MQKITEHRSVFQVLFIYQVQISLILVETFLYCIIRGFVPLGVEPRYLLTHCPGMLVRPPGQYKNISTNIKEIWT